MTPKMLLAILLAVPAATAAEKPADKPHAQKPKKDQQFMRLVRDAAERPVALETAIVRFVPADRTKPGPTVDLIAAVHIAEKGYYQEINKAFESYDVVLYELVAPTGTRIPKGGGEGSGSFVSIIQKAMKDMLQLEYQLEIVDYTRKNLVHADMSPEQFSRTMRERGESIWGIVLRMMGYAIARQANDPEKSGDADLLLALFDKNRALALKRVLAEQIEDIEGSLLAIEGNDGSTIVSGRNKIALEVLRKEIAGGKKKIAIFYGAAHMPDFQQRLRADFGLAPASTRWLTAWDMKGKK
jgi:hypothetical protein